MHLKVNLQILPKPERLDPAAFNAATDGLLEEFEQWFIRQQQASGAEANALIGAERGVLKAYLYFLATKEPTP